MAWSTIILIVTVAADWMVYKKMGREGWESIVPFYNMYVLCEELYGSGWKFLLLLIPIYNIYFAVVLCLDLARAFNKGAGYGLGLLFLHVVFLAILAFDSSIVYRDGSKG